MDADDPYGDVFTQPRQGLGGMNSLAAAFAAGKADMSEGNQDLTYNRPMSSAGRPPSQPAAQQSAAPPQQQPPASKPAAPSGPLFAKPVDLFKLENGEYKSVGRTACAVMRKGDSQPPCQVFCYFSSGGQNRIVCAVEIDPVFEVKFSGQYASWSDTSGGKWSGLFQTTQDAYEFGVYCAVARYLAYPEGSTPTVIQQASSAGEGAGAPVAVGDTVKVGYSMYKEVARGTCKLDLTSPIDQSPAKDPLVMVVGTPTGRAWEAGVEGIVKGEKRVVVLHSSRVYGQNDPLSGPVAVVIEVKKIKRGVAGAAEAVPAAAAPSAVPSAVPEAAPVPQEVAMVGEAQAAVPGRKDSLQQRMAKMGAQRMMIPIPGGEPAPDQTAMNVQQQAQVPAQPVAAMQAPPQAAPAPVVPPQAAPAPVSQPQAAPAPVAQPHSVPGGGPPGGAQAHPQGPYPGSHANVPPANYGGGGQTASMSPHQMQGGGDPYQQQRGMQSSHGYYGEEQYGNGPQSISYYNEGERMGYGGYQDARDPQREFHQHARPPPSRGSERSAEYSRGGDRYYEQSRYPPNAYERGPESYRQSRAHSRGPSQTFGRGSRQYSEQSSYVEDKVDQISNTCELISDKLEKIEQSPLFAAPGRHEEAMSNVVLLQNIQRMIMENEQLRKDANAKADNVLELREQIKKLHQKNEQQMMELSKQAEERQDALSDKAKKEKKMLYDLQSLKDDLEQQLHEKTMEHNEQARELDNLRRAYTELQEQFEDKVATSDDLSSQTGHLKEQASIAEGRIAELESQLADVMRQRDEYETERDAARDSAGDEVKRRERSEKLLEERVEKHKRELADTEEQRKLELQGLESELSSLRSQLNKERLELGADKQKEIQRMEQELETHWNEIVQQKESAAYQRGRKEATAEKEKEKETAIATLESQHEETLQSLREELSARFQARFEKQDNEHGEQLDTVKSAAVEKMKELQAQIEELEGGQTDMVQRFKEKFIAQRTAWQEDAVASGKALCANIYRSVSQSMGSDQQRHIRVSVARLLALLRDVSKEHLTRYVLEVNDEADDDYAPDEQETCADSDYDDDDKDSLARTSRIYSQVSQDLSQRDEELVRVKTERDALSERVTSVEQMMTQLKTDSEKMLHDKEQGFQEHLQSMLDKADADRKQFEASQLELQKEVDLHKDSAIKAALYAQKADNELKQQLQQRSEVSADAVGASIVEPSDAPAESAATDEADSAADRIASPEPHAHHSVTTSENGSDASLSDGDDDFDAPAASAEEAASASENVEEANVEADSEESGEHPEADHDDEAIADSNDVEVEVVADVNDANDESEEAETPAAEEPAASNEAALNATSGSGNLFGEDDDNSSPDSEDETVIPSSSRGNLAGLLATDEKPKAIFQEDSDSDDDW